MGFHHRQVYEESVDILHRALRESKVGRTDKVKAIKRLSGFYS